MKDSRIKRRTLLGAASLAALAGLSRHGIAANQCAVFDKTRQAEVTPARALELLAEGNQRFTSGTTVNCNLMEQVHATAHSQAPFAAIVGCIDSRVPPELVFDQKIGDIFAARIAGNFVNMDIVASLEFATKVTGAKAIVVLGHSECGAIKSAIDGVELGNITAMLKHFDPAVKAAESAPDSGEHSSKNHKLVQAVADINAQFAAKMLVDQSEILRELVTKGELAIAAAMHDIGTGRVTFFT